MIYLVTIEYLYEIRSKKNVRIEVSVSDKVRRSGK